MNADAECPETSEQSTSPPHSLRVGDFADNFSDIVRVICDLTPADTSSVTIRANCYVPAQIMGAVPAPAWFILLNTFEQGGAKNWSVQVAMMESPADPSLIRLENLGGSIYIGGGLMVDVNADEWFSFRVDIDLDADSHDITVFQPPENAGGGVIGPLEINAPWSAGGVGSQVAVECIDLFSNGATNAFYWDDVSVEPLERVSFIRGDADGNTVFNGVVDGIFLLNYQFVPGSPPIPPPFPGCGLDDDAALGCLQTPVVCP